MTANSPSGAIPDGNVNFFNTTTNTAMGTVSLSAGQATLATTSLLTGTQIISMSYLGNGNFLASSTNVSVTIVSSIYVLHSTAKEALTISNNGFINVPGVVMVNSSASDALRASGNAKVTAGSIKVVGGVKVTGNATLSPTPVTGVPPVADPMASLPAPTGGVSRGAVDIGGNTMKTIDPGIYTKILVAGNAKLTLNPGVYVLAGGDFRVTGNGMVTGAGVMIYMANKNYPNAGGIYGSITVAGNLNLTAATTGTYAGVVIFQARLSTNVITIKSDAVLGLGGGLIYAPKASMKVTGTAQVKQSPIVVNLLNVTGSSGAGSEATPAADATNVPETFTLSTLAGLLTTRNSALNGGATAGASVSALPASNGSPVAVATSNRFVTQETSEGVYYPSAASLHADEVALGELPLDGGALKEFWDNRRKGS